MVVDEEQLYEYTGYGGRTRFGSVPWIPIKDSIIFPCERRRQKKKVGRKALTSPLTHTHLALTMDLPCRRRRRLNRSLPQPLSGTAPTGLATGLVVLSVVPRVWDVQKKT